MSKLTYEELIEQKVRDDAVLQSIGDGLIVLLDVDKGGKIVYVNKVFEEATGWKAREVLHKSVIQVIPREDKEGKRVPFKERIVTKVLAGEKVVTDLTEPFYYIRKDKTKFPVASVITPIVIDKKIVGAVETFRDISREYEVDKAKTEFASLVSHQLRSPFSTINWYVEELLTKDVGPLNEKQEQYLQEVYKASKRMVALITVLLSVSRIERGVTELENKLTDVVLLAQSMLDEEQQQIKKKNLTVEKTFEKDVPQIMTDPKQLTIVLQNLLSNAIKYTPDGGKIRFTIERDGNNIRISVSDTGMGIPKGDEPKIFERFFRADNAKERDQQGVGLGLYISKAVIDLMHGKIWFTSQEHKGTTFYVTIPVQQVSKKT